MHRALPFVADTISYLYSLIAVARVRQPLQELRKHRSPSATDQPPSTLFRSMAECWRFVRTDDFLRAVAAVAPLINLAYGGTMFLTVLTLNHVGESALTIGLCQALIAAGGLAGAALTPQLLRPLPHTDSSYCCAGR